MKNIFRFIIFILLVGGWTVFAAAVHVVRTPEKLVIVPKDRLGFADTYVDVRLWTLNDAASHPELVNRLVRTGKSATLSHVTDLKPGEEIEPQLSDAVRNGPTSQPAPPATRPGVRVQHAKPAH